MPDRDDIESTADRERARSSAGMRLLIRAVIAVAVVGVMVYVVPASVWPRISYWLDAPALVNLGDIRALRASGTRTLQAAPGSFVRIENLIVTKRAETSRHNFFWCPLFNILVRTKASLPPVPVPSGRIAEVEVPEGLDFLIEERKIFPEDLAVRFDAQGWLLRLTDIPGWKGPVGQYAREALGLSDEEAARSFALLDGEAPDMPVREVLLLIGAVVISLVSIVALFLAWRAWARLR